ncbi:MAG: glycoside hydrolase family 16 protein [Bacteroidetes bacterium]|nr:glycoside hydrolase family 16 protein [Bacteroidota bacterium]
MKTYTKFSFMAVAFGALSLGACKKSSNTTNNNNNNGGNGGYVKTKYNTNSQTANATCDYDSSDTSLTNHGWTKVFDDEFTGSLSNWYAVTGGVAKELECNEPANVQVSNGVCTITAKQQSVTGPKTFGNDTTANFNFTSGWIVSNATFAPTSAAPKMRIIARLKTAAGKGLTSTFYSFADSVWPTNGELDFMENKGDDAKTYAVDYFYGSAAGKNEVTDGLMFNPTTEDLSACYHVYMMEWTQNTFTAYLDGNLVETSNSSYIPNLFNQQHHLAFAVPIGGLYYTNLDPSTVQGGTMTIDYVKVFTSN